MRRLKSMFGLMVVAVAFGAVGCGAPADFDSAETGGEPLGEVQNAFVNNISFVNCNSAQITKIRAAGDILSARINEPSNTGASMRACLNDTFLSMANQAEWGGEIWNQYKRVALTRIECVSNQTTSCAGSNSWAGCAGATSGESMLLASEVVSDPNATPTIIAGVIGHELAHNYGHNHPVSGGEAEYNWSIPQRARACIENFNSMPSSQSRTSGMPGEVELGYLGRFGGSPFEFTGVGSQFVSGIDSFANATINAVSVELKDAGNATAMTARVGGASGVSNIRRCNRRADDVAIGISGTAGTTVNQLTVRCARRSNLNDWYDLAADGNANGFTYSNMCPAGKAMRALRGRSSGTIDQLRVVCDDVTKSFSSDHAPHKVGPILGSTSGVPFSLRCTGNGAFSSFSGQSDSLVRRLGGLCRATGGTLPVTPSGQTHPAGNWVGAVPGVGAAFSSGCNSDELMIGAQVRSGGSIDAIAPICARANDWDQSATTARTNTTFAGGGGGTLTQVSCPAFQFLVGLELWGTDKINGLQAVCADMR